MARKKKQGPKGAPEWVVTFGDMMSLLLTFFILLLSMSEIRKDETYEQVVNSIERAFGYTSTVNPAPGDVPPMNSLIMQLQAVIIPPDESKQGDTDDEGIDGRVRKVTDVRDGIEVIVGGRITFDRFSAVLKEPAMERMQRIAELIKGKNTKIIVRGHATNEPLPSDAIYQDAMQLSFARAAAVADALEEAGIRPGRIRVEAVGDREPINAQAYTEERRAVNRRVEIIVTEALVDDYQGKPATIDLGVLPDGQ